MLDLKIEIKEMEKKSKIPITEFGRAVRDSGFSMVCPKCFKKWSNRKAWTYETVLVGKEKSAGGFYERVREHSCGGQMFYPYSFIGSLADANIED